MIDPNRLTAVRPNRVQRLLRAIPLAIAALDIACQAQPASESESLGAAEAAYARFELDVATRSFTAAYEEAALPASDRAAAAIRLAAISRLVHDDTDAATMWLERATEVGGPTFDAGFERVRVLLANSAWSEAEAAAAELVARSSSGLEQARAASLLAQAAWQDALTAVREGRASRSDSPAAQRSETAQANLALQWGRLDLSLPAVGLALAADDGASAFLAWTSYFQWAGPDDRSHITAVAARIGPLLRDWRGVEASRAERRALIRELVASRMFEAAEWLARDPRVPAAERVDREPEAAALLAYAPFRERLASGAQAQYRRRALDDPWTGEIKASFDAAGPELWPFLEVPGNYDRQAFLDELRRRFGADINFRGPQGRNLNYGHRVDERTLQVDHYGRSATFNFVRLDFMVSNGFNSWFWDGGAATGGWADGDTIVQIRPAYARGPVDAWVRLTDEVERQRSREDIERQRPIDAGNAQSDPYGYFEGLALRLRAQAHDRLLDSLREQGREGLDLRRAFISELSRLSFESSIVAHEGRHAIDRSAQPLISRFRRDAEREFRAKLSEVAFAPDPRIALIGGIINANIGADTGHGQANARIMRGLVDWMRAHADAIPGLDTSAPLLPQLDRLEDEQLRAAIRAMDPWAGVSRPDTEGF